MTCQGQGWKRAAAAPAAESHRCGVQSLAGMKSTEERWQAPGLNNGGHPNFTVRCWWSCESGTGESRF